MGPEFEKGDGRLRPSLQQCLPGAEGPPEECTTAPRLAACGGEEKEFLRWQSGFCEEGRSSNASQFARDADADAAAGTTAAAGRAAAPASGRIEPARREGADLTRPTGRPRRRAHVALSKPSATPLRLPSRRLPCSLVAQAIDS